MTHIHKTALVPYRPRDMFALVNDIEAYPKFLPWCKSATVLSRTSSQIVATITMGGAGLEKSFTTRNVIQAYDSIDMHLLEGPFSQLQGRWTFEPLGEQGCKVSLNMEFEVSNQLLRVSLGPIFSKIVNNLVDAFVQRANDLYGKS